MNKKQMQEIVQALQKQGWAVDITKGGHYRFKSPSGRLVFGPSTPGDYRGLKNCKAWLRREGAEL